MPHVSELVVEEMIKIFLCDPPMKIVKGGLPENRVELGERQKISEAHIFQGHPSFQGDKELVYYDTEKKKLVRRYSINDWGKII